MSQQKGIKRGICALCREEGIELTEHHATNKPANRIMICKRCHKLINEGMWPK